MASRSMGSVTAGSRRKAPDTTDRPLMHRHRPAPSLTKAQLRHTQSELVTFPAQRRLRLSSPPLYRSPRHRSECRTSAYLPGFTNLSVIRSDSPIARYLSRSLSPSPSVGGRVHTPSG